MTRPHPLRRDSHHGHSLRALQNVQDWVRGRLVPVREQQDHPAILSAGPADGCPRFAPGAWGLATLATAAGHSRFIASKNAVFSSGVPTDMRIAFGKPIQPSGRTITPACNIWSLNSLAPGPTSTKTKFVSLGTGRNPIAHSPSCN